jgi:hypothetical protein
MDSHLSFRLFLFFIRVFISKFYLNFINEYLLNNFMDESIIFVLKILFY